MVPNNNQHSNNGSQHFNPLNLIHMKNQDSKNKIIDELNTCGTIFKFYLTLVLNAVGVVSYFVDVGLDLNLALWYHSDGWIREFGWTLAFIVIPALINTAVSFRMYNIDKQKDPSFSNHYFLPDWCRKVMLFSLLAPVLRHLDVISFTRRTRKAGLEGDVNKYYEYSLLTMRESTDAAFLRILECLLETVPQQVLQLSFLLAHYDPATGLTPRQQFTIVSLAFGVVLLVISFSSYMFAVMIAHGGTLNQNAMDITMQALYHLFVTLSRVMAIAMVAYLSPLITATALAIHIIINAAILQHDPSHFFSNKVFQIAFSLVLGVAYIFTYILPNKSMKKYLIYSSVCFIENIACATLWYTYAHDSIRNSLCFKHMSTFSILMYCIGVRMLFTILRKTFFFMGLPRLSNYAKGPRLIYATWGRLCNGGYGIRTLEYYNGVLSQKIHTS